MSEQGERVIAELWQLPTGDGRTIEEIRHGAAWLAREPLPEGWRGEAVDAGGVAAEWSWIGDEPGADTPVLLVLHGGAFMVCDVASYRRLSSRLADAVGGRSLTVDYRRAPEHPFPAAVDDCAAAYRWVLAQGVDAGRIVVIGDSAGGNLCLGALLLARDTGLPMPAAIVAVSPMPDLTFAAASYEANRGTDPFSRIDDPAVMLDAYLRGADPLHPLASPLYADLRGFPPLLVLVGPGEQHLGASIDLAERAAAHGVDASCEIVDGAFHTWLNYSGTVPEADASIARIGDWIRGRTRGERPDALPSRSS